MPHAIWTQPYPINSLVLTPDKRLGLFGALSILQDTAWIHADHLGHGYDAMARRGTLWVLARQRLDMARWPSWGEGIAVRTWVRPADGFQVHRDFQIEDETGATIGLATASWLVLDGRSRRPRRPDPAFPMACREEGGLATLPEKIAPRDEVQEQARFDVRHSDLDLNGHVNNTRYAQWVLDSLDADASRLYRLDRYQVNFLAETRLGDSIAIEAGAEEGTATAGGRHFQGRRLQDGKVAFTARLDVSPREA